LAALATLQIFFFRSRPCHIQGLAQWPSLQEKNLRGLLAKFPTFESRSVYSKEAIMEKEKMLKRISELETINDQLLTELNYLDQLLKQIGFEQGLITLKAAAQELIEEENQKEERA